MLDRDALDELYGNTDFSWATYANAVRKLSPAALTRSVPGSGWPSLAGALRHIVSAYDGWLHETLRAGPVIVAEPDGVTEWAQFEDWRRQVRASFRRLLDDTPGARLHSRDTRVWGDGDAGMSMSVADVLAHVLLHERGHHGDVTTLLFQLGAAPPVTDYGVYLWFKRRRER